jgi:hypothetical protein
MQDNDLAIKIRSLDNKTITFKSAVDFLYLDDHYFLDGFLTEHFNDPCLEKLHHNLQNRNHFVRAAVISYATITPEFFPSKMWAEQYRTSKYRINVFCPKKYVEETSRITKQVLKDEFGLTLNKLAFEMCHQEEPD